MTPRRWLLLAAALVAAFWLGLAWCARAEAGPYTDSPTAEWFRSLKQPGSGFSCCDQSDCRAVPAIFMEGQWWAATANGKPGELAPIPDSIIIKDKVSPIVRDGEGLGVLCESMYGHAYSVQVTGSMGTVLHLFCFTVPPTFSRLEFPSPYSHPLAPV